MPMRDPRLELDVVVDEDLLDLVPEFVANRRAELATLTAAVAAGRWPQVRQIGHRWKGLGGMYGFGWLTHAGTVLELRAQEATPEVREVLEAAEIYLAHVVWR